MKNKFKLSKDSLRKCIILSGRKMEKISHEDEIRIKLEESIEKLKEINDLEKIIENDRNRFGEATIPAELWQEKFVYQYNFFGTMLGIIDKALDSLNKSLLTKTVICISEDNVLTTNDSKQKYIKKLFKLRKEIVQNFKITKVWPEKEYIVDTFETYPSHSKFSELYQKYINKETAMCLELQLINAYNNGYINGEVSDIENMMGIYRGLYTDLTKRKYKNQDEILQVKIKLADKANKKKA